MTSAISDERVEWVRRVLGVSIACPASAGTSVSDAMATWQAARSAALQSLATLEAAVRKSKHPEIGPAVVLLRAIRANLTEEPDTIAKVNELVRYISDDDIIATAEGPNVFGLTVRLRGPLLLGLAPLRASLSVDAADPDKGARA